MKSRFGSTAILFIVFIGLSMFSCTPLDLEPGGSGFFEGTVRVLEDNRIGVEGFAEADLVLFPVTTPVKWTLGDSSASYFRDTFVVRDGDTIEFWFIFRAIGSADWETTVAIGADLCTSAPLRE